MTPKKAVEKKRQCDLCHEPDKDDILCGCEECGRLFCQGCNSSLADLCVECS